MQHAPNYIFTVQPLWKIFINYDYKFNVIRVCTIQFFRRKLNAPPATIIIDLKNLMHFLQSFIFILYRDVLLYGNKLQVIFTFVVIDSCSNYCNIINFSRMLADATAIISISYAGLYFCSKIPVRKMKIESF